MVHLTAQQIDILRKALGYKDHPAARKPIYSNSKEYRGMEIRFTVYELPSDRNFVSVNVDCLKLGEGIYTQTHSNKKDIENAFEKLFNGVKKKVDNYLDLEDITNLKLPD